MGKSYFEMRKEYFKLVLEKSYWKTKWISDDTIEVIFDFDIKENLQKAINVADRLLRSFEVCEVGYIINKNNNSFEFTLDNLNREVK